MAKGLGFDGGVPGGPAWLRFSANAQCNYFCGIGAFNYCTWYIDSACANNGTSLCTVTVCGLTCNNSQGQMCGPGPNTPPNCQTGLWYYESCWQGCHSIPCGCDIFCSQ
jgi:hypothetical protein